MNPWEVLAREHAPDGGELVLHHRSGEYVIRVDGQELMSSRVGFSEAEMARAVVARLDRNGPPLRVLIGGLGMGFTARAAPDVAFERRLRQAGYAVETIRVRSRGPCGGAVHTIFLGRTVPTKD